MKFNICILLCISVMLALTNLMSCSHNKFHSKIHSKNKNKNKFSSMNGNRENFLHYMAMKNKENNDREIARKHKDFNFKSKLSYEEKTLKFPITPNQVLSGWLAISSKELRNIVRFPPLQKLDANEKEIVDDIDIGVEDFRINHAAKDCTDPLKPADERFFWFRMDCDRIWYSSTASDLNILGVLKVTEIEDVKENNDISGKGEIFCLTFKDDVHKEWRLCSEDENIITMWYCVIKECMGQHDGKAPEGKSMDKCYTTTSNYGPKVVISKKVIKKPIIMVPLPSPTCNQDWNYDQNGDDWECTCQEGKEQSPIDLPPIPETIGSPVKPMFQYKEIAYISDEETLEGLLVRQEKIHISVEENLLQIWHKDFGKSVTVDGTIYNAQRITFHTPSNHKINGKQFPLELSIIHFGVTKGDIGKSLVLNFLFDKEAGVYNSFFEDLDLFSLPDKITKFRGLQKPIFIPKLLWNDDEKNSDIPIMKPFSFYTYEGSQMFPPCNERTINLVASKPLKVSNISIELIKESIRMPDFKTKTGDIIKADTNVSSNRSIQPSNGRPIFHYNHEEYCGPDKVVRKPKKSGHYEKVINKGTQYFFVNGAAPSGMPGAFVVSEKEAKGLGYNSDV
jgi:carbonic anhydrase